MLKFLCQRKLHNINMKVHACWSVYILHIIYKKVHTVIVMCAKMFKSYYCSLLVVASDNRCLVNFPLIDSPTCNLHTTMLYTSTCMCVIYTYICKYKINFLTRE